MKYSALALVLLLAAPAAAAPKGPKLKKSGKVAVTIGFSGNQGKTKTDGTGIQYMNLAGDTIGAESTVYPKKYWGIFPLYFFGSKIGVDVGVVNKSRKPLTLCVETEAHSINANGSSGGTLLREGDSQAGAAQELRSLDVSVAAHTTKLVDGSFVGFSNPGVTSGLDRFNVVVSSGTCDAPVKVLVVAEGVLCPPETFEGLQEFSDFLP